MSDPDWIGPAADCLKEHVSEEAGEYLLAAPAKLAKLGLLERAVAMMEREVRDNPRERGGVHHRFVHLIAEHRGETPEETIDRLRPVAPAVEFDRAEVEEAIRVAGERLRGTADVVDDLQYGDRVVTDEHRTIPGVEPLERSVVESILGSLRDAIDGVDEEAPVDIRDGDRVYRGCRLTGVTLGPAGDDPPTP